MICQGGWCAERHQCALYAFNQPYPVTVDNSVGRLCGKIDVPVDIPKPKAEEAR